VSSCDERDYRRSLGECLVVDRVSDQPGLDFKQFSLDHTTRVWQGDYPLVGKSPAFPAGSGPLGLVGCG
jgi:hypothetical protein